MSYESKKAEHARLIAQSRTIAEKAKAENRGLTAAEQSTIDNNIAQARAIGTAIAEHQKAANVFAGLNGMAADAHVGSVEDNRRLTFKGMAAGVVAKMVGDGYSAKALAPSGAAVVGQEFEADPIALGRIATGLLDVLPVARHASAEYAYLRQTTRTNNAAVVAEGDVKPTSVLGVTRVEATLQVVAHLSEAVPRYWLADSAALQTFIDNELRYGLGVAVDAKVVDDINGTSGIQTQAFSTSALETIRKALTKIETQGYAAGAIVMHPSDFEGIELALASAEAVTYQGLPYDAARRMLFGVPIASTISATAGTGFVLAQNAVRLDTDTLGVGVQWSENAGADTFARNQIVARCEGRFATSVLAPLGVVKATLAAA